MSQYSDEPRFTIEQIDLLQRLRRSGMTKPEILQALDTLERLDRQHGHKFPHRPPLPGSAPNANANANANSSSGNVNAAASSSTTTSTATQTGYRGNGVLSSPGNSYNNNNGSPPPPLPVPAPVAMVTAAAAAQNGRGGGGEGLAAMTNGKLSPPPQFHVSAGAGGVAPSRGYGFEAGEEDMDIEDKVEELMRRDSAIIKEEIKAFLGNRRISQAVVAQVTGISQSRISHWLLQQGSDLSEQKKRAFYRWYHLEKSSPGNTAPTAPPSTPHHPQPHAPAAPQDPSSSSASPRAPPPPPSPPSLHSVQSLFSCSTRSIHY